VELFDKRAMRGLFIRFGMDAEFIVSTETAGSIVRLKGQFWPG
jgi:hypothetical protein